MKHRRFALTLVEILIVVALLGIVTLFTVQLFLATASAQKQSADRYDIQNSMRVATLYTDRVINESTAIFTIPEGRFFEANLTDGWSYFGLSDDKTEIIRYVYESRGGQPPKHHKEVLVPKSKDVTYGLEFYRPDASTGFAAGTSAAPEGYVGYKIKAYKNGAVIGDVNVDTALEAKNALQVVFRGTATKPSIALAYRSDQRPSYDTYGTIGFVLDNSGSMQWPLGGGGSSGQQRIQLLRAAMTKMLERLMIQEKLVLQMVPFSKTANYPDKMSTYSKDKHPQYRSYDPSEAPTAGTPRHLRELDDAKEAVKKMTAYGSTNLGDGLRRAYFGSLDMKAKLRSEGKTNVQQYVIVLVDGVATTLSGKLSNPGAYAPLSHLSWPRNYKNIRVTVGGESTYLFDYFEGDGPFTFSYWGDQSSITGFNNWKNNWLDPARGRAGNSQFADLPPSGYLPPYQDPSEPRVRPKEYANRMAQRLRADSSGNQIRTYLIGFSERPSDLLDLAELAVHLGIDPVADLGKRYFRFERVGGAVSLDLEAVFRAIETDIMTDLWHVRGPNL